MSGERTDFRLVLPFSEGSLGAASSEVGDALVGEAGSFFARAGAMGKECRMRGWVDGQGQSGDGCSGRCDGGGACRRAWRWRGVVRVDCSSKVERQKDRKTAKGRTQTRVAEGVQIRGMDGSACAATGRSLRHRSAQNQISISQNTQKPSIPSPLTHPRLDRHGGRRLALSRLYPRTHLPRVHAAFSDF